MIVNQALETDEVGVITELVRELANRHHSVENEQFLSDLSLIAHELPWGVRKFFDDFRLADDAPAAAVLSGFPVAQNRIGPTPSHWDQRAKALSTVHEEIFLMLCGAVLGDIFGWATLQGGYLVHDILPVKDLELEQIAGSSKADLYWHTEDAFHPYRADFVGLMCLRNPGKTETTIGILDPDDLEPDIIDLLFQPRFRIHTDKSHTRDYQGQMDSLRPEDRGKLNEAYAKRREIDRQPACIPILRGCRSHPELCIDPVYMDDISADPEADRALVAVIEAIERSLFGISLRPGDVLFLDNRRVVHGRRSFSARYDGADRWLKRIYLTRDISKSRDARGGSTARLIF